MHTTAVVLAQPERLSLERIALVAGESDDVLVDIEYSGISTGTERLLWSGRMPAFPGLGYPLVPGYESVGRVVAAPAGASVRVGQRVFVPGAKCYGDVRGLFGGAASRVSVPAARVTDVGNLPADQATLLALAATAHHAIVSAHAPLPSLVVGHGVLGRLVARIVVALGGPAPVVWEREPTRFGGARGYAVTTPEDDPRRDHAAICDVSGDPALLDTLIAHLARGGEVVLAGFYAAPLAFSFAPAFIREARLRVAAEWAEPDLTAVLALVSAGRLSLVGLITHREPARRAPQAYRTAFSDPTCLKMILDWSNER
jgi:3-hydroxyethyl bacteriochlorophyllide a dehydrogenase